MSETRPSTGRDWSGFWSSFLKGFPPFVTVAAALIVLFGAGSVTPKEAVDIASAHLGVAGNATALRAVAESKADALIGAFILILVTAVQLGADARGPRTDTQLRPSWAGRAAALVVAMAIGGAGWLLRDGMADRFEAQSQAVARAEEKAGVRRVREVEAKKHLADDHFQRELMNRARGGGLLPMRETPPPP
jgi:hypothetical protein